MADKPKYGSATTDAKYKPPPPHTPGKQMSEETKAWFYKQVRAGRNAYQVGKQIGISRASVRRLMIKAGGRWADSQEIKPRQVAERMFKAESQGAPEGDLAAIGEFPDPITSVHDLKPKARQAYKEFGYWRTRYLHRRNIAWQIEMALLLMAWYKEAQKRNERIRGVVNTPPGGGKTTTITHDFPGWLISRDRNIRIALGSRTTPQSTRYTRRLRNTLERNALLNLEFGRFKPMETEVWRQDQFIVDGVTGSAASMDYKLALAGFDHEDPKVKRRLENPADEIHEMMKAIESVYLTGEKEPTVTALSQEMGFLGGRYDINLWDDLVDDKNSKDPTKRDDLFTWWEEYAVSRCEPGGIIGLIGTRFTKYDLFKLCKEMTYTAESDVEDELLARVTPGMTEDQIEEIREDLEKELVDRFGVDYQELPSDQDIVDGLVADDENYHDPDDPDYDPDDPNFNPDVPVLDYGRIERGTRKVYRYVKYPAHNEAKCLNPASTKRSSHIDCLIDPQRFNWYDLMRARASNPRKYALTYQQEDEDTDENLIQEVWLTGGVDSDGVQAPGCFNYERRMLEIPRHLEDRMEHCFSIATVDPSAQNWWSVQWWIWDAEEDKDYLIALLRARLSSDSFLSFSRRQDDYHGVMHQWQIASAIAGWPIGIWIIEQSAAQRFLFKHTWVNEWMQQTQTQIMGHDTNANKADEEFGVETLRPRYRLGLVDIPFSRDHMQTQAAIGEFKKELTEWPDSETEDMVMGHWFLHFQRYRLPTGLKVTQARRGIKHPYNVGETGDMPGRLGTESIDVYTEGLQTRPAPKSGHRARRASRRRV